MAESHDRPPVDAILQKVLEAVPFQLTADGVEGAFAAVSDYSDRKRSRGDIPLGSIVFDDSERRRANRKR